MLTKLQKESQFGAQELKNVMSSFQQRVDPAKHSLSRDAFGEVIKELFDNVTPKLCTELFDAMDVDGSGTVDYSERVTGCAKVMHDLSTEDRFKMIFEAYDRDGNGTIEARDLMRIAEEKGEQLAESMDLVHDMMMGLDTHPFHVCGCFQCTLPSRVGTGRVGIVELARCDASRNHYHLHRRHCHTVFLPCNLAKDPKKAYLRRVPRAGSLMPSKLSPPCSHCP
eukprot:COSAG02_NODE_2396_length_8953_cov_12.894850_5_plen_224_part_00